MTTTPAQGWRVKLYQLNGDGQWDDRGTGSISVTQLDVFGGPGVLVKSEEGGRDLLQSRILEDREAYSLQGENIITWEERLSSAGSVDLALSFQENEGCLHIWNQIQEVQGNYAVGGGGEGNMFFAGRDDDDIIGPTYEGRYELKDLPECRLNNLEQIRDQLICPPMHRENLAGKLVHGNSSYLKNIISLFGDIEDLDDGPNLVIMSQIMRSIVVLNDNRLLEVILLDESIYEGIIGGIEYDPDLQCKGTWRDFLKNQATFHEVVSMDNHVELRKNIHIAFRAAMLRDAATRPGMDDGALSGIISYLYFTHGEIISTLIRQKEYLKEIVSLCIGHSDDKNNINHNKRSVSESRGLALRFLQEMCSIAKSGNIPLSTREELFVCMIQELPFYEALTASLSDLTLQTREINAAAEILSALVASDQGSSLRAYILRNKHPTQPQWVQQQAGGGGVDKGGDNEQQPVESSNTPSSSSSTISSSSTRSHDHNKSGLQNCPPIPCKESILSILLHLIAYDDDLGCLLHYNEIMSKCVEVEMMEPSERDEFLQVFYDHYIFWLMDPLVKDESKQRIPCKTPSLSSSSTTTTSTNNATALTPALDSSYINLTQAEKTSRGHISDLLSYCFKAHTYRMRYFALRNGLVARVVELCKQPEKYLQLAGLRFIRACVGTKDDFLNRHLVKKDHFASVFAVFVQNGARDNLISSAVIDIVEFIRTENISSLIKYIVESFPGIFDDITYVTTFKALKLKYEQNSEYERSKEDTESTFSSQDEVKNSELRKSKACDDEEAYFDGDDDEDEVTTNHATTHQNSHLNGTTTNNSETTLRPLSPLPFSGNSSPSSSASSLSKVRSPRIELEHHDHDASPAVMPGCGSPNNLMQPTSPSFKARPLSPPVSSKDKDSSLGLMFDMNHRAPGTARNPVRKIEMVIGGTLNNGTTTEAPNESSPDTDKSKRQKL
mmetsp:Transcript_43060/g.55329  ORF Transcript_43060/g.55329 Transcript_43060/m.55329 type:complete len:952 (+) Transcript_43060:89-2944(+)